MLAPLAALILAAAPPALAQVTLLEDADRALNHKDLERADRLYRRLLAGARVDGAASPRAAALDGLAAIFQLRNDFRSADRLRVQANAARARAMPVEKAVAGEQLGNGGFEDGLAWPWGSGHYERPDGQSRFGTWWPSWGPIPGQTNLRPTLGFIKADAAERHSGRFSLRLTNLSPSGDHIFLTTAQRIRSVPPNSLFEISVWVKSQGTERPSLVVSVDPGWRSKPLHVPKGSYEWRRVSSYFTNGFNTEMEIRLLMLDQGTVWLDDLRVKPVRLDQLPDDLRGSRLKVELLFNRGDNEGAIAFSDALAPERARDTHILRFKARGLIEIGRYPQALEILEDLVARRDTDATYYKAEALSALGRHREAFQAFAKFARDTRQDQMAVAMARAGQAQALMELARDSPSIVDRRRLVDHAERLLEASRRVLKHIGEGETLVDVAHARGMLAVLSQDDDGAFSHFREGFQELEKRLGAAAGLPPRQKSLLLSRKRSFLVDYLALLRRLGARRGPDELRSRYEAEAFMVFQRLNSTSAGSAMVEMAARSAARNPALSRSLRALQDLSRERQRLASEIEKLSLRRDARERGILDDLGRRMDEIDQRLAGVRRDAGESLTRFDELANQRVLSLKAAQDLLRDNEALVVAQVLTGGRENESSVGVQVVTREWSRWIDTKLDVGQLRTLVARLRCGLDMAAWYGGGALACAELTGTKLGAIELGIDPLPFDLEAAHRLYHSLFADLQGNLEGRHLLFVASGPLAQLPLHVLLSERPGPRSGYTSAAWLSLRHAITILPDVSSLSALRSVGRASTADRPLIGFANPLLDGIPEDKARAALARRVKVCGDVDQSTLAWLAPKRGLIDRLATPGGRVEVAVVRRQRPLPETATELCAVARALSARQADVRLGVEASEAVIKRLDASGELSRYRILHFATHGVLAGELDGASEPGLILTPPRIGSAEDDGFLSASEVASLKLDANMVVLSACNTAAGNVRSAEALSGLARAFIYAQARSLLVSHWAVYSDATVRLVTRMMRELGDDRALPRAEALRRAMNTLIASGSEEAHPSYWAPFVVVGEGGAAR